MNPTPAEIDRDVAQPESSHPTRQCERHSTEDESGIARGTEGHQEQTKDHEQRDRDEKLESRGGGFELLERATVVEPIAWREFEIAFDPGPHVGDKGSQIAGAHVGAHDDAPFGVLPAHLVGSRRELERRDLRHRNQTP